MRITQAKSNVIYYDIVKHFQSKGMVVKNVDPSKAIQTYNFSTYVEDLEGNLDNKLKFIEDIILEKTKESMINIYFLDMGDEDLRERVFINFVYNSEHNWVDDFMLLPLKNETE